MANKENDGRGDGDIMNDCAPALMEAFDKMFAKGASVELLLKFTAQTICASYRHSGISRRNFLDAMGSYYDEAGRVPLLDDGPPS